MFVISHRDQVICDLSDLNPVQVSIEIKGRHQVHAEDQLSPAACDGHLSYELCIAQSVRLFHIFKVNVDPVQIQVSRIADQLADASSS